MEGYKFLNRLFTVKLLVVSTNFKALGQTLKEISSSSRKRILIDNLKQEGILSEMRKIILFFLLCLPVLYYIGTVLSWEKKKRIRPTGDEPHYLMISESIRKDGDFDLKNNYEEDRNTKKIIGPVDVENHTTPKDGKLYSIHSIGTSCLTLIGYSIFGITGARISLALLAGIIPFYFISWVKSFIFRRKRLP